MNTDRQISAVSHAEVQAYIAEAHRLRGEAFAGMIKALGRGIMRMISRSDARRAQHAAPAAA